MEKAVVVDDHPVVLVAVEMVLMKEGFKQIFKASTGPQAMALVREHGLVLMVLDVALPGFDGLEVLERIKAAGLPCRSIMFTAQPAEHFLDRCVRSGAMAYVAKTKNLDQLQEAIRAVKQGYMYLPGQENRVGSINIMKLDETEQLKTLSGREFDILRQLARGKPNKIIAQEMYLSVKTVSTYKTRLMQKLNVKTLVGLSDLAKRNGLA